MGRSAITTIVAAIMVLAGIVAASGNCRCRYQGKLFDHGQLVCIHVDGKTRLARCGMALNNSSWIFLADGCPSARMTPIPPRVSPGPAG